MIYHLCLGANLGDPEAQIAEAAQAIGSLRDCRILRYSSIKSSPAWGMEEQPDFYNQVLEVESALAPQQLLVRLLKIETEMGRIRKEKWGPRIIDIDILLAEDLVLDTTKNVVTEQAALPELIIPHPELHRRIFALQLLNELIPEKLHPVMQSSISELYYLLTNSGGKP